MAKEEKEQKQAEEQEKQIPEKPKKKSGGMSMPMLLGVIGAIVIFQAVLIFLLFKFFIAPQPAPAEGEHAKTEQTEHESDDEDKPKSKDWKYDEFTLDEKLVQLYETGRITTNPKNSDKFVIIDLAIIYIVKDQETLEEIHAEKAAAGGGGHGGEEDHSLFTHKQRIRIKGTINNILGSYSDEQLFAQRDSLPSIFKHGLAGIIDDHRMKVKEVIVQEFIIQ
jgi:flagellar basal body-associated protein FliL